MLDYTKINSETWDLWASNGCEWSRPISHDDYEIAREEDFVVYLTPCIPVPHKWFGGALAGRRLLGLASGGGQQMPYFAKFGAVCTVFDNSEKQLDAERLVAGREGYPIDIVRGDMTKPLPFEDETFDLIFHPVSNCYIEDVQHVWNECLRILKPGGILLAGMDNGINFLFEDDAEPLVVVNRLPFNPLKMSAERRNAMIENGEGVQFSHTLEEQIGGQLRAGFVLKDLYEDRDRPGSGVTREFCPQYFATMALKPKQSTLKK